jgi:hypothetical protein
LGSSVNHGTKGTNENQSQVDMSAGGSGTACGLRRVAATGTSPTQDPSQPGAQAPQSSQLSDASSSADAQSKIGTVLRKGPSLAAVRVKVTDRTVVLSGDVASDAEKEMKRHKPHVPILLISGAIDLPEDCGVRDQFLSKLAGPQELLQKVEILLERKIA